VTVTWAHWGLKRQPRAIDLGPVATIALGMLFLTLQRIRVCARLPRTEPDAEHGGVRRDLFMLTGFHGLHVTIGTIMLIVILIVRSRGTSARPSLRLEGVFVVLALRRRGLAAAVRAGLLVYRNTARKTAIRKTEGGGNPRDTRAIGAAHTTVAVFLKPALRNDAEVVADHEQQDRVTEARRARSAPSRAVRLSPVADQVDQREASWQR